MKIKNLDPKKYERFFSFGCSFTNYKWPTWADIIGHDVPIYQNWGREGAGNHFIFNSIVEANAKDKFTHNDLVIVMWTHKEREDRYFNHEWVSASNINLEKVYGKNWFLKYGLDTKGFLIRDLALIDAAHSLLDFSNCDWESFAFNPIVHIDDESAKKAGYTSFNDSPKTRDQYIYWMRSFDNLCDSGEIDPLLEHQEVLKVYKDVFRRINKSFRGRWSYDYKTSRISPDNDPHPTPIESLNFLENVWPNNNLSQSAKDHAILWNNKIFENAKSYPRNFVDRL